MTTTAAAAARLLQLVAFFGITIYETHLIVDHREVLKHF